MQMGPPEPPSQQCKGIGYLRPPTPVDRDQGWSYKFSVLHQ